MKCFRQKFPFKLGTTSYIYPVKENNLIYNVESLADKFDIIQLLFMGKDYLAEVMVPSILAKLEQIQKETKVEYIVHLPMDFNLLNPNQEVLSEAVDLIGKIMDATRFLAVSTYILHIDCCENFTYPLIKLDQETYWRFEKVLLALQQRLGDNFKKLSIENIGYDLTYFKDLILKYEAQICFDIGHVTLWNYNFADFVNCFKSRINVVHLHGVLAGKDHLGLAKLDQKMLQEVIKYLQSYDQELIIEVFDENNLLDSLNCLTNNFRR